MRTEHYNGQALREFAITDKEFWQLSKYIKANYGISLKEEKRALVIGRLHNVLMQNNFKSFSEYFDYVVSDRTGNAVTTLVNKITTNHTFFMREADHFRFFKDAVLPYLAGKAKDRDLRIWSAGCSSGEEPYTLAMIISDYFGPDKKWWDTKILATDISSKVLEAAKQGRYDNEELANIPVHWKNTYFKKYDIQRCAIADKIKNEVIFRKFNLMDEIFPFKRKFNVIFCRNVMIYFDSPTKHKLVNKFYDFMEPGGYLFIGHSESLNRDETKYRYLMPAVYRKE